MGNASKPNPGAVSLLPVNTWEQVGYGGVFITYCPADSRTCRCAKAQVVRNGYKTDPDSHWSDYGNKTFLGKQSESVPQAKKWATERYGIKNWKRNRTGDWIDADANLPPLRERLKK